MLLGWVFVVFFVVIVMFCFFEEGTSLLLNKKSGKDRRTSLVLGSLLESTLSKEC